MEKLNFDQIMDNFATTTKTGKSRAKESGDDTPGLFPAKSRAAEPLIPEQQSQENNGAADPETGGSKMQRTEGMVVEGRVQEVDSRRYGVKVNDSWFKAGKDTPVSNFKVGQDIRFVTRMTERENNGKVYENWWINDLEVLSGPGPSSQNGTSASESNTPRHKSPDKDLQILYGQLLNLGCAKFDITPDMDIVYKWIEKEFPRVLAHRHRLLSKAEKALENAAKAEEAKRAAEAAQKAAEAARKAQEAASQFDIETEDDWGSDDPGFGDDDIPF